MNSIHSIEHFFSLEAEEGKLLQQVRSGFTFIETDEKNALRIISNTLLDFATSEYTGGTAHCLGLFAAIRLGFFTDDALLIQECITEFERYISSPTEEQGEVLFTPIDFFYHLSLVFTPEYRLQEVHITASLGIVQQYISFFAKDELAGIYLAYGLSLYYQNKSEEALKALEQAEYYARQSSQRRELATILNLQGTVFRRLSYLNQSVQKYLDALTLMEEMPGIQQELAKLLNNLAGSYRNIGNTPAALHTYKRFVSLHKAHDPRQSALVFNNLGLLLTDSGNIEQALEYFASALEFARQDRLTDFIFQILLNTAAAYYEQGNYEKCQHVLTEAHTLRGTQTILIHEPYYILLQARIHTAFHNFEQAHHYLSLLDSLPNVSLENKAIGKLTTAHALACPINPQYSLEKATHEALAALALFQKIAAHTQEVEAHFLLSQLYEKQGNISASFEQHKLYTKLALELRTYNAGASPADIQLELRVRRTQAHKDQLATIVEQLREENSTLTRVNDEKNEFLGIATHDLKNPVITIMSLASLLEKEAATLTPEELVEFVGDIKRTSQHMFELITNLLDINRIEQGAMKPSLDYCDIANIADTLVKDYTLRAQEKSIRLLPQFESNLPRIVSDEKVIQQVFDNLLSNAIKYSMPNSRVWIHLKSVPSKTEPGKNIIVFSVQDEGQGLTPEDMKNLFRKFTRLSARPTAGESSTGLGLSIARKMVEMLGGTIECESEYGKGAEFFVSLPIITEL